MWNTLKVYFCRYLLNEVMSYLKWVWLKDFQLKNVIVPSWAPGSGVRTLCALTSFIKSAHLRGLQLWSMNSLKEKGVIKGVLFSLPPSPFCTQTTVDRPLVSCFWWGFRNYGLLKDFYSSCFQKAFSTACPKSIDTARHKKAKKASPQSRG